MTIVEPLPPADVDAERAIINAVYFEAPEILTITWLKPGCFTHPVYRQVWTATLDLLKTGKQPDFLLVMDALRAASGGELDEGTRDDVYRVAHDVGSVRLQSLEHYARIVQSCAMQRSHIDLSLEYAALAYRPDPVATARHMLSRLVAFLDRANVQDAAQIEHEDAVRAYLERTERFIADPGARLMTGFPDIDRHIGGLGAGDLIYIAARPKVGKSGLALSMAARVAGHLKQRQGGKVLYVTLEMSIDQCVERIIAGFNTPAIDTQLIRAGFQRPEGFYQDEHAQWYANAAGSIEVFGGHLTWRQTETTTDDLTMLLLQDPSIRLVIVDQFDKVADKHGKSDYERLTHVSRQLKRFAMRCQVPVICLTQINRDGEDRGRPTMSDLKGTGGQEQDADVVLGLYSSAAVYPVQEGEPEYVPNLTECIIMANRRGPAKRTIPLWFIPEATQFTDWPTMIDSKVAKQVIRDREKREKKGMGA